MSMAPDCGCAGPRRAVPTVRGVSRVLVPALALALVPKCPLCLAAYLSVIGLTAGAAAPWLRVLQPVLAIAAVLTLGAVVVRLARRASSTLPLLAVVIAAGIAAEVALRPGATGASRIAALLALVVVLTWAELTAPPPRRSLPRASGCGPARW
jgi:hypothetical protein